MAARLIAFFAMAKAQGGLALQIQLAGLVRMASPEAAKAPDSPENIARFEEAMKKLGIPITK